MSISIDGSSLVFDGQVLISNFTNPAAGVVTLTLTPSGGVGSLPAFVNGEPGLPPTLALGTVTTLATGSSATATLTQTAAGGPGSPSAYTLGLGIPTGATGSAGTNATINGASDLSGTAAVGDILTVNTISPTTFVYSAFPWALAVNPSSISSVSASGQTSQQLCSVSIAAQTADWVPFVFATAVVAGTVNTVVNLQATLTAGLRSGDIIGQASGYAGQATQGLSMNSGFGALIGPTQAYGEVTAGSTATIVLKAIQTASTPDAWSITNTTVQFTVLGVPVGP